MIRALAPHWREAAKQEKGEGKEVFRKIVNMTSISGTMGNAGQANYSSAKAGVTGLTKTIAKEWGQFKINVNAVAFGFVETRLTQAKEKAEAIEREGEKIELGIPEQQRAMASMIIPLGRPAQPAEAAGPVLFLCSDLSQLHPRPGAERHGRAVRRHGQLGPAPDSAAIGDLVALSATFSPIGPGVSPRGGAPRRAARRTRPSPRAVARSRTSCRGRRRS